MNIIIGSGMLSTQDDLSFFSSGSFYSYKEDYISESLELVNTRPYYKNLSMGIIYKSKYEILFSYLSNSTSNNIYNLPYKDKYFVMDLNYHIKKLNFANFKVGCKLTKSKNNDFSGSSFNLGLYNNIDFFNNPVILYFDYISSSYDCILCTDNSVNKVVFGGNVNLLVDKLDNNELKDIIFFGLTLNSNDLSKYYFGIHSGLFIPIK